MAPSPDNDEPLRPDLDRERDLATDTEPTSGSVAVVDDSGSERHALMDRLGYDPDDAQVTELATKPGLRVSVNDDDLVDADGDDLGGPGDDSDNSLDVSTRSSGGRVVAFCRRHRILSSILIVLFPLLCLIGYSWVGAMTKEGSESFMAKNVQWLRDMHLGFAVDRIEQWQYGRDQPESGGTPDSIAKPSNLPGSAAPSSANPGQPTQSTPALPKHIQPPAPLKSPAPQPIDYEGVWNGAGPDMGGGLRPMYYTKVRPNAEKTSLLIFVAWIDPNLAKIELHPGTELPGGKWLTPPRIPEENCGAAIAGLNSGFRMDQARGGYYAEERTQQQLRNGAASLVLYKDGRMDVGMWGRDLGPDQLPNAKAVRQNLELIVDNGAPVPDIDKKDWGALLPNSYFIWRTAFGITKEGALIYVGGPALQPRDLAQRLIDAGAVRAMEMDINPEWMTANLFAKGSDGKCHGVKGLEGPQDKGGQRPPADRYLSTDTRDFVAIYSKS